MNTLALRSVLAATLTAVSFTGIAAAGDVNPPAGPVDSTMKPLTDVEPRTAINSDNTPGHSTATYAIYDSGSYYLTENLIGESGKNGIEINAYNVTIDLSGFTVQGDAGTFDGIVVAIGDATSITIINGTVHDWGFDGIDLLASDTASGRIQNIVAHNNGDHGIVVEGSYTISDCVASFNGTAPSMDGGDGIDAGNGSSVLGCTSRGNAQYGIAANNGLVMGNTVTANLATGLFLVNCTQVNNHSGP